MIAFPGKELGQIAVTYTELPAHISLDVLLDVRTNPAHTNPAAQASSPKRK